MSLGPVVVGLLDLSLRVEGFSLGFSSGLRV